MDELKTAISVIEFSAAITWVIIGIVILVTLWYIWRKK